MREQHQPTTQRNLLLTVVLNFVITAAQVIGGVVSGSLALISDAIHNLSDSLAVMLAWMANRLSVKPRTNRSTFGYQRAEILAAFINALVLIAISLFLVFEAVRRFLNLREVDPRWMFWLGLLGLVVNGLSVWILHRGRKENINIKAAYLHLLGDALTSFAVILGAAAIYAFNWYWVDPVVTLFISFYLIIHTYSILKESIEILMQMSPPGMDTTEIGEAVSRIEGVQNAHHIHVWKLNDSRIHFEGHITLPGDMPVSETGIIHLRVKQYLKENYDIEHVTLQFEYRNKAEADCNC